MLCITLKGNTPYMGVITNIYLKEILRIKCTQCCKMESAHKKLKWGCKMYSAQENHLLGVINPL